MGGYIGATGLDEVQEQFDILKDEIDANASYINTLAFFHIFYYFQANFLSYIQSI